ncbi:flavin reductase family protein [Ilyomonas limi]|uniref:Flavin reductase family protein n=1 Tax=Ilyomonas limi TaxID=2575867 RepID=A0A4U3KUC7_9BACT|nr:flavin reductase family protein [Ilyomonas limi]TKK65980.1 flavin reductase family protein [Ilyomonas limi]
MHKIVQPAILYFGTPVILISTINQDGSYNLAPISSAFWLGWRCMIGISAFSKTTENIIRTRECVLNLPSEEQVASVNYLARTTGSNPVPEGKRLKGYRYEPDKFDVAGVTATTATKVKAPLVQECPVQLEAKLIAIHKLAADDVLQNGRILTMELKIVCVHTAPSILMDGCTNRIDPDKWRPLIMSFQKFYGLSNQIHYSTLAEIPENLYTTPDIEEAKMV